MISIHQLAEAVQQGMKTKLANMPMQMPAIGGDAMKSMLMGGAIASPLAYMLANHFNQAKMQKTRNHAFGAGVAAGVAGPKMLSALNSRLGVY